MTGSDGGGGPPRLDRVRPEAPGASYGLSAREVTSAAGIAAGLAWSGPLAAGATLHLYYLAAAAQANGRLSLATDRGHFRLHFKRGAVEHASSDAPEDDIGRFLVARGALPPQAVADAERVKADFGGDLVSALASLGLMKPADSFRVLQEHGALVVGRALCAEKGTADWDPTAPLPASSFPLGSRWGMLCDAVRRMDGLAVRKLLGDRAQRPAARAGGRVEASELRLTALEARVAGWFDGRQSPAQLVAARPGEAETVLRVALLLAEAEMLTFGEATGSAPLPGPLPASRGEGVHGPSISKASPPPTSTANPTRASAPAKPPPPRPAPAAVPAPKLDLASLRAFHDKLATADHFVALGVKREASTAAIKAAYFQLAKSYHPDAGPQGEAPEVKKLRADIFARLGEAWGVLGEEPKRAAYLDELAAGGKPEVDVSAIFKAEETFQRATVFVRTRQYDKALEALGEATKLNGDEPEFAVWRAWVEFLLAADKKRHHAASAAAIEAALKKVPRIVPAYLFLGQMAKICGDLALAEKHFKRGLVHEPDHAELSRELKYLRK